MSKHDDFGMGGGEDESSTEREGEDGHLHEDQKSKPLSSAASDGDGKAADDVSSDSATKTQDLAKAGREDFDPNDGQE